MIEQKNKKQHEIYEFIKKQVHDKGYPPSVREICTAVGLSSTSTVHGHLARLEKKGLIRKDPSKPRTIEIIGDASSRKEMINIPIIGKVTAGIPILAVENIEDFFPLPIDYINSNKELFMLHVSGESMIDAGIMDGDLAILEQTSTATNGEIVVALIGEEVTIKRFFKEKDHYRLQPENKTMKAIIIPHCTIVGKLVGIYRKY